MLQQAEWVVGRELSTAERTVSLERVRRYGDGLYTATAGAPSSVGDDIHTDADAARRQGLPTAVADGMMSTNLISSMLVAEFGLAYIERGELSTKFIKPVPVGTVVRAGARIETLESAGDGTMSVRMSVWIRDPAGTPLTVGEAAVHGLAELFVEEKW